MPNSKKSFVPPVSDSAEVNLLEELYDQYKDIESIVNKTLDGYLGSSEKIPAYDAASWEQALKVYYAKRTTRKDKDNILNSQEAKDAFAYLVTKTNRRTTMHDIASYTGLSYQTISRVFNTPEVVSESSRLIISKAIKALNYDADTPLILRSPSSDTASGVLTKPNIALTTSSSHVLHSTIVGQGGLAHPISGFSDEVPTIVMINAQRALLPPTGLVNRLKGMALSMTFRLQIVAVEDGAFDVLFNFVSDIAKNHIDKILVNIALPSEIAAEIKNNFPHINFVFTDVAISSDVTSVCFNPADGTYAAFKYLKDLGHQDVVIIRGPEDHSTSDMRHENMLNAVQRLGLNLVAIGKGNWSSQSGFWAMNGLLAQNHKFTAVFAANDEMALGSISALVRGGFKVPEDVSIIGYDNIVDSEYFLPSLTTINLDREKQVELAFKKLLEKDETSSVLSTDLIIRDSCSRKH